MTRPQRQRTPWDWRLKLYPLIVIPMMVYLNTSPAVQQSAGPRTAPVVAGEAPDPVQGVTSDGRAFVWERNPRYPVLRFEMRLAQPNTIVDDRRSGM